MSKPFEFTWDDACLQESSCTIPLKKFRSEDEPVKVTFTELSKTELESLLEKVTSGEQEETIEITNPDFDPKLPIDEVNTEKLKIRVARTIKDILIERSDLLFDTLELSCRSQWTAKQFKDLNLPPMKYGYLTDMLFKLNHISEIAKTRGNLFALPYLMEAVRSNSDEEVLPK